MNKKIVWIAVSCLMVVSLLVSSCGDGVTDEEEEIDGEEEEIDGEEEEEEVDVGEEGMDMVVNAAGKLVERPRYGGEYHYALTSDVRGFDDVISTSPAYATFTLNETHDELFTGDWTKSMQGTGEASFTIGGVYFPHLQTGMLAESFELPDNETIIWHIRQGVHWQDKPPANGREYNAHDAAFNLERAFHTPGSYLYGTYRQDRGDSPTSIKALDDWTVEMKVPSHRQIPLLFAANDFVYHHCPEVIEEYGDADNWEQCIGTGPFMLVDYVPVSTIRMERNPNYWRNNPLHPEDQLPYIDAIQYMVIPDTATSQAAFRTGKIETRTGIVKDDWEALVHTNPELMWRQQSPGGGYQIHMRQDKPELPYDDIRVRKALFYAIDHQEILDEYYEGLGEMINVPIPSAPEYQAMFTPLEEYPEEVQKLYGYYPEEARELLADAGYPDGFECTCLISSAIPDGELTPIIKDYWERNLNVIMNMDVRTGPVISSLVIGERQEDMYYGSCGTSVLKCNQWRTDSYLNYGQIVNEEFNEWFVEFEANMLDWDTMARMMKEIEPKMRAQAYFIDFPNDYTYYMWWPWLKGYNGETGCGYFNTGGQLTYLWIDTDLRTEMTGLSR
ncbi:MAG: ABC transporter substrate-binding protein [Dehalococcoidales bacterium]|nr:MAG: ABC transporter substrate-binding protein [Dehalococcoidales bacterium]